LTRLFAGRSSSYATLSSAPLLLPSCTLDKHVLQGRILGWYERSGTRSRRDKEEGKTALLEGKTEKGLGLSRLSSLATRDVAVAVGWTERITRKQVTARFTYASILFEKRDRR